MGGVIFGGKFGLRAIAADRIVDCTASAVVPGNSIEGVTIIMTTRNARNAAPLSREITEPAPFRGPPLRPALLPLSACGDGLP